MGSQAIQGKLWGQRVKHWADIQEPTGKTGYNFVLEDISINASTALLDIGCGSGYFCKMASKLTQQITGLDATPELIAEAQNRVPQANFLVGEMEELPFNDNSFDLVCGFNSFQYAAHAKNALTEALRVLNPGGKLVAMIWGNKEDCEAASYLKAVGGLLPAPPPGAAGPFALSENQLLENLLEETGFKIINNQDIPAIWDYPDTPTALNGLMSAGPVARAIENVGFEKVYSTLTEAIKPYEQANGRVVYHNKFRIIIASKSTETK
ncbi:class I SAM-dependent methyltransferase [Mucilaginibacter agri]|uniref:Methyltransferase domain-containing protein n=1 Tax=Mucilaginibacter agri TaxID=2695265 RepID=A0A965ZLT9_9SPHI|nr:class I SAM-dependent methyltransferase [Mucilaginibacter agri]NCD72417.1 methyltransferase domain-containing protein [Mucilaginibacter agri]